MVWIIQSYNTMIYWLHTILVQSEIIDLAVKETNLASQSRFILKSEPMLRRSLSSWIDLMLGMSAAGATLASWTREPSILTAGAGIVPDGIFTTICCWFSFIESWIAAAKSPAAYHHRNITFNSGRSLTNDEELSGRRKVFPQRNHLQTCKDPSSVW